MRHSRLNSVWREVLSLWRGEVYLVLFLSPGAKQSFRSIPGVLPDVGSAAARAMNNGRESLATEEDGAADIVSFVVRAFLNWEFKLWLGIR